MNKDFWNEKINKALLKRIETHGSCGEGCVACELLQESKDTLEKLNAIAIAAEKVRQIAHNKGFDGKDECSAHNELVCALHDVGVPCMVQPYGAIAAVEKKT